MASVVVRRELGQELVDQVDDALLVGRDGGSVDGHACALPVTHGSWTRSVPAAPDRRVTARPQSSAPMGRHRAPGAAQFSGAMRRASSWRSRRGAGHDAAQPITQRRASSSRRCAGRSPCRLAEHPGHDRRCGDRLEVVRVRRRRRRRPWPGAGRWQPSRVEQPAAVERVDEHRRVDLVAQQEVAGHADADERHADAAADLHREHRERDRDADAAVEHLVEERVARVVVVVGVAGKPPLPNRWATSPSRVGVAAPRRRGRRGGRGRRRRRAPGSAWAAMQQRGLVERDAASGPRRQRRRSARTLGRPSEAHGSRAVPSPACPMACTRARTRPPRPTSRPYIMARLGRGRDLRRARRRGQPAVAALPRRSACAPATTSRSAWRTTPASSRSRGAPTTPGSLHGCSSRLTVGSWRTSSTTAAPRCSSRRTYKADAGGRDRRRHARTCELRLMLDGAVDGYEPLRGRRRRAAGRAARPTGVEGNDMLYSLRHDRAAEGREAAAAERAARHRPTPRHGLGQLLFGFDATTWSTCRRRRSTTRLRCASTWPCTQARRHRRRDGALRPRGSSWRSSSATT